MAEKPFEPTVTGGQSIADLLQPGQQLSITITNSTGSRDTMQNCTVVASAGSLLEVQWQGNNIIVNTASPNFVMAARSK